MSSSNRGFERRLPITNQTTYPSGGYFSQGPGFIGNGMHELGYMHHPYHHLHIPHHIYQHRRKMGYGYMDGGKKGIGIGRFEDFQYYPGSRIR
jgi:hypothetical protein